MSLQRLQELEQALHSHTVQRQSSQAQLAEVQNALDELGGEAYRLIGGIMVQTPPEKLRSELEDKKQTLSSRVAALERQEKKIRDELEKLKDKALKGEQDGNV